MRLGAALGGNYQLGPELGRGGMAVVYRATDRRLRREVAVKVLPPELGYSSDLRTRFVREAQTAAQLSHPNIVPIYDVGEQDGLVWFIMALVEGESVRAKVEREGPQPLSVVRRVLEQAGQALAYAHAKGVIHRDVKPDNIMIERGSGRALMTDFGIAKALGSVETDVTKPGEIVGTARYMAPEQALGEGPPDARGDIYALGLVGYFMLTATHAIRGSTLRAVIAEHMRGVTIDFGGLDRRVPVPLATALGKSVAAAPAERFERLEQFLEELRKLGGELPDVPAPVRRLLRDTERTFVVGTLGAFALGVIGVEHVPAGFLAFLLATVGAGWLGTMDYAARRGVTWSDIRRALYLERARRVEEMDPDRRTMGFASGILIFAGVVAAILLSTDLKWGAGSPINIALFWFGAFGGVLAARLFGMPRRRLGPVAAEKPTRISAIVVGAALGGVVFAAVATGLARGMSISELAPLVLAVLLTVALLLGGFVLIRGLWRGTANLAKSKLTFLQVDPQEWRVPRWLDTLGSWLFARVSFEGWRPRIVRDRPAAAAPQLDLHDAQQVVKAIHRDVGRLRDGTTHWHGRQAEQLARDLLGECRSAARHLRGLSAKAARLNDGAMVSHTLLAGGSLETELDRLEREADGLRAGAAERLQLLEAIKAALAVAVASHDGTVIEKALVDVKRLASTANAPSRSP